MNDSILKLAIADDIARTTAPAFDLAAIMERKQLPVQHSARPRKRVWLAPALLLLMPALAAAAVFFPSPQAREAIRERLDFWFPQHKTAQIVFLTARPIAIGEANRLATFHIVLPTGLPKDARLKQIYENGTAGDSFSAIYVLTKGEEVAFQLQKAVPNVVYGRWLGQFQEGPSGIRNAVRIPAHVWIIGNEAVTVASRYLNAQQLTRIKSAMHAHDARMLNR